MGYRNSLGTQKVRKMPVVHSYELKYYITQKTDENDLLEIENSMFGCENMPKLNIKNYRRFRSNLTQ